MVAASDDDGGDDSHDDGCIDDAAVAEGMRIAEIVEVEVVAPPSLRVAAPIVEVLLALEEAVPMMALEVC